MKEDYIEFENKDNLGIIKLNHLPVNSLNLPLMDQLNDKLMQIEPLRKKEGVKAFLEKGSQILIHKRDKVMDFELASEQKNIKRSLWISQWRWS
jgi:hypothetical protein